jgi:hypothetical protein
MAGAVELAGLHEGAYLALAEALRVAGAEHGHAHAQAHAHAHTEHSRSGHPR